MKILLSKLFLIHFGVIAILCSVSSSDAIAQSEQYKIRLAHGITGTPNSPHHVTCLRFAELVNNDSNGRIKIEVFGFGVLGNERAVSEQVSLGGLEMAQLGIASGGSHLSDQIATEELPYAWKDYDQILNAYNGDLGKLLRAIFLEKGKMVSLSFIPFGARNITNNVRPIRSSADVAGLKLRSAEVPLRLDAFRALKAQVVPIPAPELFAALQQGIVDGQENPLAMIRDGRYYEVQKYLALTGHILSMNHFVINESFYKKLPDDLKQILSKNAQKMQAFMLSLVMENEKSALETLKKSMTIVEDVDKNSFRKAMLPVYEKYKKVFQPEIWAAIEKYSSVNEK